MLGACFFLIRLLAAASRFFGKVVGIDIHPAVDVVEEELKARGIRNFQLFHTDGAQIPLPERSVEVVYSFIVLQHVEKVAIFRSYLKESFRVLVPSGTAVLYFGRKAYFSKNRRSLALYWMDRLIENVMLPAGYREISARVNATNLLLTMRYVRRMAKRAGFARRRGPSLIQV